MKSPIGTGRRRRAEESREDGLADCRRRSRRLRGRPDRRDDRQQSRVHGGQRAGSGTGRTERGGPRVRGHHGSSFALPVKRLPMRWSSQAYGDPEAVAHQAAVESARVYAPGLMDIDSFAGEFQSSGKGQRKVRHESRYRSHTSRVLARRRTLFSPPGRRVRIQRRRARQPRSQTSWR